MKWISMIAVLLSVTSVIAQRDLTPSSRKKAFGGQRDFRDLASTGLQIQLGPTFMMSKLKNETLEFNDGTTRGNYVIDPSGKLGGYLEVGLMHFPKKQSKLSKKLNYVFVSYFDWGVGFKYLGAKETTTINYTDVVGNVISTDEGNGSYYNGYVYGRFSLHKNFHFGKEKNFFLDNSLGVNVDYRIIDGNRDYSPTITTNQYFHEAPVAQLHYGLGFGFRLRRGTYIIPGARMPIMGLYEWNKAKPSLRWFSSNYVPILFHVKFMNLFQKRQKGTCRTVGTEEDKKKNSEFLQGN